MSPQVPPAIDVPPPIGSAAWDRELVALGTDRATVDRELRLAVDDAVAAGTAEPDGHDVYLNDASPETAAVLVLFHQERPSYSALMYLRFVANKADGRTCGRLAHWSFPFRRDHEHLVLPGRALDEPQLHRIDGSPHAAADLVDREVELWPAGLREYLAQRR